MLGFILSKLNLLILVTAMFAIISFFLFNLGSVMVSNLAQQKVNDFSETAFGMVSGSLLCRQSSQTVPEYIEYFGGLMPSQRFYYVMYIKRYPEEFDPEGLNTLIFQIASRKERDKILAAGSIDLNARIYLYDYDPQVPDILEEKSMITIDPMSEGISTKNGTVFIKEIYKGQTYLHVIACSSSPGICERNTQWVACWISKCADNRRESSCFPSVSSTSCSTMGVNC